MFQTKHLTVDGRENILGLGNIKPKFSWTIESEENDFLQKAYQIMVSDADSKELLWDSGKVEEESGSFIPYSGRALKTRQRCKWKVRVWNTREEVSEWSSSGTFEMGLLQKEDWKGKWIEPVQLPVEKEPEFDMQSQLELHETTENYDRLHPCLFIRKEFEVKKPVKKARIYATAHGVYCLKLDGSRVGDQELAPGFTSYKKCLQYQTYDITENMSKGRHVLGIILSDGWYAGRIGMLGDSAQYGNKLAALLQIVLTFADGTEEIIGTDGSFRSSTGEYVYSDLYIGEKIDYRLKKEGWCTPGFCQDDWSRVNESDYGFDNLEAQADEPVRIVEKLKAADILKTPKGETVIDFGRVTAGRVSLLVTGDTGMKIILEHSEVLDKAGNFLNNINGRNKDQKDIFVLADSSPTVIEPSFTFHGFRYVRVSGYSGELKKEDATALVLSSDLEQTGDFTCSDPRINQLQKNICQSQQGNMISVPTDCPQRERAGWTGDIQIFAPTACFNRMMYSFLNSWMENVRLEQYENGGIPNIIPFIPSYNQFAGGSQLPASAGWGDAVTIVPWALYQEYGDKSVLEKNYPAMKKWVEYIRRCAAGGMPETIDKTDQAAVERQKYLWNTGQNLGDWLIPSIVADPSVENMLKCSTLTQEYISTCFYEYSTDILAQAAEILGKTEDAEFYGELARKIRDAYTEEYVPDDGYLGECQGVYVMALQFCISNQDKRKRAAEQLVRLIRENGNRLDTGFVSTPFLLDVLCREGYEDLAYQIMFQTECPSWLYEVEHGATTIWESWNAVLPDGTPLPVSYNHYAFGCVGDWMYRNLGGIRKLEPGYKKMQIKPGLNSGLSYVKIRHKSVFGIIGLEWKTEKSGHAQMWISIPANTTAEVTFPGLDGTKITEKNVKTGEEKEVYPVRENEEEPYCEIGSGTYHYIYNYDLKVQ